MIRRMARAGVLTLFALSVVITTLGSCLTSVWDAGTCALSTVMACNAPVTISPVRGVLGLGRAASA